MAMTDDGLCQRESLIHRRTKFKNTYPLILFRLLKIMIFLNIFPFVLGENRNGKLLNNSIVCKSKKKTFYFEKESM